MSDMRQVVSGGDGEVALMFVSNEVSQIRIEGFSLVGSARLLGASKVSN